MPDNIDDSANEDKNMKSEEKQTEQTASRSVNALTPYIKKEVIQSMEREES